MDKMVRKALMRLLELERRFDAQWEADKAASVPSVLDAVLDICGIPQDNTDKLPDTAATLHGFWPAWAYCRDGWYDYFSKHSNRGFLQKAISEGRRATTRPKKEE